MALPAELTERLRALGRREGVTLFMTLLAGYQVLLARCCGQEDIVVGTNVAGRSRTELEGLIGCFINTLVIRTDFSRNPTLGEALQLVREVCLEAHAHQDVPFEKLLEALKPKRENYSPLFQAKFDLLRNARTALNFSNVVSSGFGYEGENSRYDIFLTLAETEQGLRGVLAYSPDLFDRTTVEHMARDFTSVLECFVTSPETRVDARGGSPAGRAGAARGGKAGPGSFKEFKRRPPAPIKISRQDLINAEPFLEGRALPLLIRPAVGALDLLDWAANNTDFIAARLREHGAILFRDFNVGSVARFEQFIKTTSAEIAQYKDRSSPRSLVEGNIYTSTDHPADQPIFLHNENSYSCSWPLKLFFHCVSPPAQGGETSIADNRRISGRIDPRTKERFEKKGVMYVRNFGGGFGLPWQTVFQTEDKAALEGYCRSAGIEVEWRGPHRLRTRQVRPALARHPGTGELLWFNHAVFFHTSTLEPALRESLLSGLAEEDLPYNVYYGDGTDIEPELLDGLREIYRQETVLIPWRRGDVAMLDNMLAAHGRQPYLGTRQVVVGMAEPWPRR